MKKSFLQSSWSWKTGFHSAPRSKRPSDLLFLERQGAKLKSTPEGIVFGRTNKIAVFRPFFDLFERAVGWKPVLRPLSTSGSFVRRPKRPIVSCSLYSRAKEKTIQRFSRRTKRLKWKPAFTCTNVCEVLSDSWLCLSFSLGLRRRGRFWRIKNSFIWQTTWHDYQRGADFRIRKITFVLACFHKWMVSKPTLSGEILARI